MNHKPKIPPKVRETISGDVAWLLGYYRGVRHHHFKDATQRLESEHLLIFMAGYVAGFIAGGSNDTAS